MALLRSMTFNCNQMIRLQFKAAFNQKPVTLQWMQDQLFKDHQNLQAQM